MRVGRQSKLSILVVSLIFTGCASFQPGLRVQDLMAARQPTVKELREGLEISVEEFGSTDKSRLAFDADIAPYGVLALLVRIENKGAESYNVRRGDIKAYLGEQPLPRLFAEQAANQAATSEYVGKALGWTLATGPAALILWPVTIASSASHTQTINQRIRHHFAVLELNDARVRPNQTEAGFVYFKLPDKVKKLEHLTLIVEPSKEQSDNQLSYKLFLPTLELSAPVSTSAVISKGE